TKPSTPADVSANALWSAPGTYSLASAARARSPMNGTISATSLSLAESGDGPGEGSAATCADCVGTGEGLGSIAGKGDGALALLATTVSWARGASSSLVNYTNPATPMATIDTTANTIGHNQFGAPLAALAAGFFTCGIEMVPSSRRIATM